jgi:hypothetical protein
MKTYDSANFTIGYVSALAFNSDEKLVILGFGPTFALSTVSAMDGYEWYNGIDSSTLTT